MTGYDYIGAEDSSRVRFRRLLVMLLIIALLAAGAAGIYLTLREKSKADTMDAYASAVSSGKYDDAIEIYRSVRERALTNDPTLQGSDSASILLAELEQDIESRLELLFEQLRNNQKPDEEQLAYAEGMAEIAGVRLIAFVHEQLSQYLVGDLNYAQITRRIGSILELSNVEPVLGDMFHQIDLMAKAVPIVIEAEEFLKNENWYFARNSWSELAARDDLGSFVSEYSYERLEHTEEAMYSPLFAEVQGYIQGGRYVTAMNKLEKMLEVFPQDQQIIGAMELSEPFIPEETVLWTEYDLVEILAIRPLIIEPEIAFDDDEYAAAANDAMVTTEEFRKMLAQLHLNNYVMVDANDLYNQDGSYKAFTVPAGKKPLVLVLDNLNYYVTRRESGNAWNLVVDDNGNISTEYRDGDGKMAIVREAEAVGVLDAYVENNPDFSYDGAKGVISLTGYECMFGYVVSEDQATVRNEALKAHGYPSVEWSASSISEERKQAATVVEKLKATGWSFASSTWGNINVRDSSIELLQQDTQNWLDYIGSITGPVDMLNYPYGAFVSGNDEKIDYLRSQGFLFMTGQGSTPYRIFGASGLYADKLPITGYSLRQPQQSGVSRILDTAEIYDAESRP